ncbi:MAG: polya polymerase [Clostridiales bacterium]|nr:polya polymerase [Clostridiales bacterium]
MKLLKNIKDVERFWEAVDSCDGLVELRSVDGSEILNLKSVMSRYIAVASLLNEHGDEYELFCFDKEDEHKMLKFFNEIRED